MPPVVEAGGLALRGGGVRTGEAREKKINRSCEACGRAKRKCGGDGANPCQYVPLSLEYSCTISTRVVDFYCCDRTW